MDQQPVQNHQQATPVYEPEDIQEQAEDITPTTRKGISTTALVIFLLVIVVVGGSFGGYALLKLAETAIKATPINVSAKYAGLDITFTTMQQADSFDDDSVTGTTGVARINISINNATGMDAAQAIAYADIIHLVGPDGKVLDARNSLTSTFQPKAGATLTGWTDFALSKDTDISKYVIRLGKAGEKQIDIPIQ